MIALTDWIEAGAAVVQAVGSVAAIWFSVKIARDGDARAREAERKAELRAIAAERAALEREEQNKRNRQLLLKKPMLAALSDIRTRFLTEASGYERDYGNPPGRLQAQMVGPPSGPDLIEGMRIASELAVKAESQQAAGLFLRIKRQLTTLQHRDQGLTTVEVRIRSLRENASVIDSFVSELGALNEESVPG